MWSSSANERRQIADGRARLGLDDEALWLTYVAMGGTSALTEIHDYLAGSGPLATLEVQRLAAALNDEFTSRGQNHPIDVGPDGPEPPSWTRPLGDLPIGASDHDGNDRTDGQHEVKRPPS